MYVIDSATGNLLWQNKKMPSGSPGIVWLGAMDGQFYAFDAKSSAMLWSYDTASHNSGGQ
ncbi:MAG: PQQ-binding-like beta-propeller repeat protein [Anaerolineae bacterium]|nr:PQQ-binding-like beta-propeller repeat protein [Anaerolineae bacterium]